MYCGVRGLLSHRYAETKIWYEGIQSEAVAFLFFNKKKQFLLPISTHKQLHYEYNNDTDNEEDEYQNGGQWVKYCYEKD